MRADRATFRRLIEDVYAAWNTLDPDAPARFYAKDPDLVFYDPQPPLEGYKGWSAFREQIRKNVADRLSSMTLTLSGDLHQLDRRGDVAWAAFPFRMEAVTKEGQRLSLEGRHTIVWERRDGQWLIVHEHPSTPVKPGG